MGDLISGSLLMLMRKGIDCGEVMKSYCFVECGRCWGCWSTRGVGIACLIDGKV